MMEFLIQVLLILSMSPKLSVSSNAILSTLYNTENSHWRLIANNTKLFSVSNVKFCAVLCKRSFTCIGFNYNGSECELIATGSRISKIAEEDDYRYYSDNCATPPTQDYCFNKGDLILGSCLEGGLICDCADYFRGNRCEINCTFNALPGKDLNAIGDIGIVNGQKDVNLCLTNCTKIPNCKSMMFSSNDKRCIYKAESQYTKPGSLTGTDSRNILYSIKCDE